MTVEKALAILDDLRAWNNTPPPDEEAVEALSLAISTLRAQQDAEKNEPLTLGELRQMDGEPVWVEPYLAVPDGWYLVDLTDMALRRRHSVIWIDKPNAASKFTAYRRPPVKEE
jgi:hypothetical protein